MDDGARADLGDHRIVYGVLTAVNRHLDRCFPTSTKPGEGPRKRFFARHLRRTLCRRKVRVGIDVGGTFTDAALIDNETYEVIEKMKIPTTHHDPDGVAKGIVQILNRILSSKGIDPEDVVFIAHGTTQATNALLEGDVARVGIIGMGSGLDGLSARSESNPGDIELAPGKYLQTYHTYLDSKNLTDDQIEAAIDELIRQGAEVIVASEAYSVDDPANELRVIELAARKACMQRAATKSASSTA
ncbi:hydantoinase/oxoprolinase N-terminal domain-containing protein [Paenibacillus sp. JTLBN-2024]